MTTAAVVQDPAEWRVLAARQDGVIGRSQALAAGLTRDAWDWQVGRHWTPLGKGVAVTHSGQPTEAQRRWAAVVHGGRGAALDGDAALQVLGVRRLQVVRYDVSVPPSRIVAPVAAEGFVLRPHRTKAVELWTTRVRGLPTVRIGLAALHAAAWAPSAQEAELRLCLVVQQRKTDARNLRSVLARQTRLRRRALMLAVLDDIELGAHAGSELDFLRFCRAQRLPCPDELQVRIRPSGPRYLDARYVRQRVTIEVDGAHHMSVEQWDRDTLRALEVAVALRGERVIRLTQGNLRHDAHEVARLLGELLGRR